MPLDFNTTKKFRDVVLGKTLQVPNGPQTFTQNNYEYKTQNDFANVDQDAVDTNRAKDLLKPQNSNIFKPLKYNVVEELNVIPRRANLSLYYNGTPYFLAEKHTLLGIINNGKYENESELFKFAASYIQDKNQKGPVYARLEQNLYKSTVGRIRLLDAIDGNLSTATNIITGKEPLIESNNKITVAKTPIGKGIDFLQTVAGVQFPWTEIPGDYLSNPNNPINVRPVPNSEFGKIFQDTTGVLGSMLGIQRRPTQTKKPSDLFIEYMGSGQKQNLFDMLSYSKYAPNYTTTARSQNTSKLFNFIDNFAQGVKNTLGVEAPNSVAYIGDDRGNDVKYAMTDFNDRFVRSPYYLSLLFDKVQTELFEIKKNIGDGGQISGKLTWISINSKNKIGANNAEYNSQRSQFENSLSTNYEFRDDSLLAHTQDMLDSMPTNGGEARSHIANVIDQTTRIFKEGNVFLPRGSAVQYVNKFGEETGVEYCRTWTKDRPYISYSDTMKKGGNIRKFEGTVVKNPWNLNIAPMSNGKKGFDNSSNIFEGYKYGADSDGKSFYAKKYMFSIENLAWKTSNKAGFTVLDLPFCERGPNGGRVMWFPPYDLKVSENNSATWETNRFLGRPEPIYTYNTTERTGQLSFKIIVDHPSILNLLTREYFENMSDEESDNYINAFFAGCENIDFYELIRRYTTLDKSDVENIQTYLNAGAKQTKNIENYKYVIEEPVVATPEVKTPETQNTNYKSVKVETITLNFDNDIPGVKTDVVTSNDYSDLYTSYFNRKADYASILNTSLTTLNSYSLNDKDAINDRNIIYGSNITTGATLITDQVTKITRYFDTLQTTYQKYINDVTTLKTHLENDKIKDIVVNVSSSTSAPATNDYNNRLSARRSHSVVKDFLKKISANNQSPSNLTWFDISEVNSANGSFKKEIQLTLKDLGWIKLDGKVKIVVTNYGETWSETNAQSTIDNECINKEFKKDKIKATKLNIVAPIQFYCRKSTVDFEYELLEDAKPVSNPEEPKLLPKGSWIPGTPTTVTTETKRPPIDVMKRIIMKTLSECYYFKKLEENSPLVFSSLKEQLRYFHPGFHSMTPEGLNSRLTFLQQCIRPGDTIPIKGLSDISDLNARNTSFGPPPICVLRIGDFYHSKVVIKDVNIAYDDSPWDMNPEGIGMQPMIASVTMSINFIGGQGLEDTVNKIQNALSSNFYANTEIYDERSIPTNTKIDGLDANVFTKNFLLSIQNNKKTPEANNENSGNVVKEGKYIGTLLLEPPYSQLYYTELVKNVFTNTSDYFNQFSEFYNVIIPKYGTKLSSIVFSPDYRSVKDYEITKGDNSTISIDIFGLYKKGMDIGRLIEKVKSKLIQEIDNTDLCALFNFDKSIPPTKVDRTNRLLKPKVKELVNKKLDDLLEEKTIKEYELIRNKLISSLDPLNFLTKYERDFKIFKGKKYEIELSGFTRNLLYNEYSYCIDYINNNNVKLYSDLDTTINFKQPIFTTQDVSDILSVLLQTDKNTILELFKTDTKFYDSKTVSNFEKSFDKYITIPSTKNFKFDKIKPRKNDNNVFYDISNETETSDSGLIEEGIKLNSSKVDVTNNLNYYKIA